MNEQTSKERVLQVYPDAFLDWFMSTGEYVIWDCGGPSQRVIGRCPKKYAAWDDAASRLTETTKELPSSPVGGSEPVRKVLTRADIEKLNEGAHSCGWTTGVVKNPNPACGCMCGTVYAPDGRAILSHSRRHGMRCQHADERGNLLAPKPLGDISGPKGSGGDCGMWSGGATPSMMSDAEWRYLKSLPSAPEAAAVSESKTLDVERAEKWIAENFWPKNFDEMTPRRLAELLHDYSLTVAAPIAPAAQEHTWTQREADFFAERNAAWDKLRTAQELAQELRRGLSEAAQSLHTIAEQAGRREEELRHMDQVRGYANSRANAADAVLARAERKEGEAKHGTR